MWKAALNDSTLIDAAIYLINCFIERLQDEVVVFSDAFHKKVLSSKIDCLVHIEFLRSSFANPWALPIL